MIACWYKTRPISSNVVFTPNGAILGQNIQAALNHPKLARDQRPDSAAQLQLSYARFLEFVEDPS